MKAENYRNLKTSEYLFITTAYAIIIGMLIFLTIELNEVSFFYFGLSFMILRIWDIFLPKNKYLNIIRFISNFIYLLFGVYGMYLLFK